MILRRKITSKVINGGMGSARSTEGGGVRVNDSKR